MIEQERTHRPQHTSGDPSPASLPFFLTCAKCDGAAWRAASLDETSIVYQCVDCGARMRISYDLAAMTWTATPEEP
jgi:hypothetical protein